MQIEGDYQAKGYALIRGLIPRDVARALMNRIKTDLGPGPLSPPPSEVAPILKRNALEIYGNQYTPLQTFLWALTPTMEQVTGRSLIPTYSFFRIYREDDICRVHSDRPACEHSLSLTLDYSDNAPWPLEVGRAAMGGSTEKIDDDFGEEPMSVLSMEIGDAVAYQGVDYRHGRTIPNPNMWSAHLFLHWVDHDGPYAEEAFDRTGTPQPVNFAFA